MRQNEKHEFGTPRRLDLTCKQEELAMAIDCSLRLLGLKAMFERTYAPVMPAYKTAYGEHFALASGSMGPCPAAPDGLRPEPGWTDLGEPYDEHLATARILKWARRNDDGKIGARIFRIRNAPTFLEEHPDMAGFCDADGPMIVVTPMYVDCLVG